MTIRKSLVGILSAASIFAADHGAKAGSIDKAAHNEASFDGLVENLRQMTYDNYEAAKQHKGLGFEKFKAKLSQRLLEYGLELEDANEEYFMSKQHYFELYRGKDSLPCVVLGEINHTASIEFTSKPIDKVFKVYYLKNHKISGCEKYQGTVEDISAVRLSGKGDMIVDEDVYKNRIKHIWGILSNINYEPKNREERLIRKLRTRIIKQNFSDEFEESKQNFNEFYRLVLSQLVDECNIPYEAGYLYVKKYKPQLINNIKLIAAFFALSNCELNTECFYTAEHLISPDKNLRRIYETVYRDIIGYIKRNRNGKKFNDINIEGKTLVEQIQDLWKLNQDEIREIGNTLLEKHLKLQR